MTVKLGICVFIIFYVTFVITIVIFRLGNVCSQVGAMLYKIIAVNNLPCRGDWGYLDRFLFLSCRPFPNHPICKINVLLYSSYFCLSPVFFILCLSR